MSETKECVLCGATIERTSRDHSNDSRWGAVKYCSRACTGKSKRTHNRKETPEYRIWTKMKYRCQVLTSADYYLYGARGITVCERWQKFENFFADMGLRPSGNHSIDRINNEGPYTPENCRWSMPPVQQSNKRNTIKITVDGDLVCTAEAARRVGMVAATLRHRLRMGWSEMDALYSAPYVKGFHAKKMENT